MDNKPKQYLQGYSEFYKLKFKVTPDVLIPRMETELLVDEVLNTLRAQREDSIKTIIDIGTGCGNIAISLAKNLTDMNLHPKGANLKIIATDISQKALIVAKQNAKLHGVSDQITFLKSNLLSNFSQISRSDNLAKVDIIVTNLPYIPSQRIPYLDSSVKDFEPLIALDGGEDGFELYRKLFKQILGLQTGFVNVPTNRVCQPKLIVCEIDYTHGELAVIEAQKFFPDAEVEIKTDLAYKQRILLIIPTVPMLLDSYYSDICRRNYRKAPNYSSNSSALSSCGSG